MSISAHKCLLGNGKRLRRLILHPTKLRTSLIFNRLDGILHFRLAKALTVLILRYLLAVARFGPAELR